MSKQVQRVKKKVKCIKMDLNLLDELAEVFTHRLASGPVTHTMAVESVHGGAIGFSGTG